MTNRPSKNDVLTEAKPMLESRLSERGVLDEDIEVHVGIMKPEEAIGSPKRRDYPIITGVERVIEARFKGARGHAFTDAPRTFRGSMRDILGMRLGDNGERAVFVAALNACLRWMEEVEDTVHCRDEEPESCAKEMAEHLFARHGACKVGLIGCNPAILEALAAKFGAEAVRVTDLNPSTVGEVKSGVGVEDGRTGNDSLAEAVDVLVVTGTTLVNGTFGDISTAADRKGTKLYLYGVTAAGICRLFNIDRLCFYGHTE